MHTAVHTCARRDEESGAGLTKVAVAGATGYTGQELLRLLARHPAVSIVAATNSGARPSDVRGANAPSLPALAHLWNGSITPLDVDALKTDADLVFLALPDTAAAELAPSLVDAGVRVIDLSGAFRLRDAATRAAWYPETHRQPEGVAYGLTERERGAVVRAQLVSNPGC
ncbi:MAG TPA: hypothetical protein VFF43_22590 [Caldimonas sp.]|nr:hypothetical protein [Caldimonas sp.]